MNELYEKALAIVHDADVPECVNPILCAEAVLAEAHLEPMKPEWIQAREELARHIERRIEQLSLKN